MFTDVEDRQQEELMRELDKPPGWDTTDWLDALTEGTGRG